MRIKGEGSVTDLDEKGEENGLLPVVLLRASTEAEQLPRPSHMQSYLLLETVMIAIVDQANVVGRLVVVQPYPLTESKLHFNSWTSLLIEKHKAIL